MSEEPVRSAPVLGIDIGGSGIKGAPVDLATGEFTTKRLRITTPAKSTPKNVAEVVGEIVANFADAIGDGPIGVTIPAVVTHGKTRRRPTSTSPGSTPRPRRSSRTPRARHLLVNDADAAGVAEVHYGAAKDHPGPGADDDAGHRASAPRSSTAASWFPTPSSATSRSTATTPSRGPPPASRRRGPVLQASGCRGSSATTSDSRPCSGRT